MLKKRSSRLVYFVLTLAIVAAILSAEHPGDPYQQARLLMLTAGPEATVIASAIAQNAETVVSP
jgi:hypothetical protein